MVPHNGSASHSADTDLLLRSSLSAGTSVKYILVLPAQLLVDGVCKCQRSTAGCIQLQIVMLFYDLNVKTGRAKHIRCLL